MSRVENNLTAEFHPNSYSLDVLQDSTIPEERKKQLIALKGHEAGDLVLPLGADKAAGGDIF